MKNKKLFIPTVVFGISILVTAIYLIVFSLAFKPNVTEGEFPFTITYEIDGETVTINDVYKAHYEKTTDMQTASTACMPVGLKAWERTIRFILSRITKMVVLNCGHIFIPTI